MNLGLDIPYLQMSKTLIWHISLWEKSKRVTGKRVYRLLESQKTNGRAECMNAIQTAV